MKLSEIMVMPPGRIRPWLAIQSENAADDFDSGAAEQSVDCPEVSIGGCHTKSFNAWLDEELCPLLDAKSVVIMDNVRIHRTVETRALIEGCARRWYTCHLIRLIIIPLNTILPISRGTVHTMLIDTLRILSICIVNCRIHYISFHYFFLNSSTAFVASGVSISINASRAW